MKNTALIFLLCFSTYAHAEWYEDKSIEWWMVVYSKMQCSKAADVGRDFLPLALIRNRQCVYEPENSTEHATMSVGCEKTLDTGFIFATSKEYCEIVLEQLRDHLKQQ